MTAASSLLDVAELVAREAGAVLSAHAPRVRSLDVGTKSTPTDPVSEADLAAERVIRSRLAELRPADGILGEEGGSTDGTSGLRWIVDPLDGTVNFLYGLPQFGVSVAVEDVASGGVVAGAIFDPARGEMWSVLDDGPVCLDGAAVHASTPASLGESLVATGFAYTPAVRAHQAAVVAALLPRARDVRRFGSAALDLAWTAAGRFDAYYERGVKRWDVAAGELMCRRAGLDVRPLEADGDIPGGILVAPPSIADELFALVAH